MKPEVKSLLPPKVATAAKSAEGEVLKDSAAKLEGAVRSLPPGPYRALIAAAGMLVQVVMGMPKKKAPPAQGREGELRQLGAALAAYDSYQMSGADYPSAPDFSRGPLTPDEAMVLMASMERMAEDPQFASFMQEDAEEPMTEEEPMEEEGMGEEPMEEEGMGEEPMKTRAGLMAGI